jgi:hypothetical protein
MVHTRSVKLAAVLWLVLAFLVWNVVFDRMLVLAGRRYSHAAAVAARQGEPYLTIDDWMRPAIHQAVIAASGSAALVGAIGLMGLTLAARRRSV